MQLETLGQPRIGEGLLVRINIIQPQQTDRLAHGLQFPVETAPNGTVM
jgi:hypothetical protein